MKFSKTDGFTKNYNGIRYLVLFGYWWYEKIFENIKYLKSDKSDTKDNINHNFARIRIDSYNSLAIEKTLTVHNVIILIKSVVNKNKNDCYHNIFSEKVSYKDKSNTQYFYMNFCIL